MSDTTTIEVLHGPVVTVEIVVEEGDGGSIDLPIPATEVSIAIGESGNTDLDAFWVQVAAEFAETFGRPMSSQQDYDDLVIFGITEIEAGLNNLTVDSLNIPRPRSDSDTETAYTEVETATGITLNTQGKFDDVLLNGFLSFSTELQSITTDVVPYPRPRANTDVESTLVEVETETSININSQGNYNDAIVIELNGIGQGLGNLSSEVSGIDTRVTTLEGEITDPSNFLVKLPTSTNPNNIRNADDAAPGLTTIDFGIGPGQTGPYMASQFWDFPVTGGFRVLADNGFNYLLHADGTNLSLDMNDSGSNFLLNPLDAPHPSMVAYGDGRWWFGDCDPGQSAPASFFIRGVNTDSAKSDSVFKVQARGDNQDFAYFMAPNGDTHAVFGQHKFRFYRSYEGGAGGDDPLTGYLRLTIAFSGDDTLTNDYAIRSEQGGDRTDNVGIKIEAPRIGFFDAVSVVQQPTPTTLPEVIAVLQAFGLVTP